MRRPNELTIQQAADYFDVSDDTIRRRLKAGILEGRMEVTPQGHRWWVVFDYDVDVVSSRFKGKGVDDGGLGPLIESIIALTEVIKTLTQSSHGDGHDSVNTATDLT